MLCQMRNKLKEKRGSAKPLEPIMIRIVTQLSDSILSMSQGNVYGNRFCNCIILNRSMHRICTYAQ